MKIFNKLVRDKIPQVIEAAGKKCNKRIADKEEHYKLLEEKLKEEVGEFLEDKNLEELADVLEVVSALAKMLGHSDEELFKMREEKKSERGGFEEGIVLLNVE